MMTRAFQPPRAQPQPPLLQVRDFSLEFRTRSGTVRAIDKVNLDIARGEIVGLVGESGSGKSVLAYAMLGISDRAARVTGGSATFGGEDLLQIEEKHLADLRGREISMIFQSPRTALNPIRAAGKQIEDILERHAAVRRQDLKDRAIHCLREVAIADPERRYHAYPFEMSGGMCQRVMIAMALACRPALLVADEPCTGLDVTTQAAVMDLITTLARERQMATLFITHDLALAADYCDRIVVMHAGQVVESAPTGELLSLHADGRRAIGARHPYTARLMTSTPDAATRIDQLAPVAGLLPDLRRADLPTCRYAERCERVDDRCRGERTPLVPHEAHQVACWHPVLRDAGSWPAETQVIA